MRLKPNLQLAEQLVKQASRVAIPLYRPYHGMIPVPAPLKNPWLLASLAWLAGLPIAVQPSIQAKPLMCC